MADRSSSRRSRKPLRPARLDKNFVVRDGLRNRVTKDGATGRDLFALFAFLGEAQRQGSRVLRFDSEYKALLFLRWSPKDQQDRHALRHALDLFADVGFSIAGWFVSNRHERQRRTFARVWTVRRHSNGMSVAFDIEFWEANAIKRRFLLADPEMARQMRYPHAIWLYLWLVAFDGHLVPMQPETIASKIGLKDHKPSRRLASIQMATGLIAKATGESYVCESQHDGKLRISRRRDLLDREEPSLVRHKLGVAESRATYERAMFLAGEDDPEDND